MMSSHSQTTRQVINFCKQKGKEIIANFEGGLITSDAGIVWIAELDKKLRITEKFANCFQDYRHSSYIAYSVHELLKQRVYGIILGYEDVNDHDKLRHDPALAIALEKLNYIEDKEGWLAGKSTINRLEYCPDTILDQNYHGVCYAPLYIFCGDHLLAAKLRSSNVDPADGALEELQRVIGLIREKWQNTHILVRGDSAYAREEIFHFCEKQPFVDYVIAMGTNSQLKLRASDVIEKAKNDYEQRLEPVIKLADSLFSKNENLEEIRELVRNGKSSKRTTIRPVS